MIESPSSGRGLIICLSVCLSATHFLQDLLSFLLEDILPYILKRDKAINLENCICCLDNWVKDRNLGEKWNIWHFNLGNFIFCA